MTFKDNFTDATDPINLDSHVPSGGTAWTRLGGSAGQGIVTGGSLSSNASGSSGALYQCDDQGSVDHYCQYTVAGTSSSDVCNRASDRLNNISVSLQGTTLQLRKKNAGTYTILGTGTSTISVGNTVRLESSGNAHTVYLNQGGGLAVEIGPATDAFNNTVTRQGVNPRIDAAVWLDNYEAGVLSAGAAKLPPMLLDSGMVH